MTVPYQSGMVTAEYMRLSSYRPTEYLSTLFGAVWETMTPLYGSTMVIAVHETMPACYHPPPSDKIMNWE